MDAAAHDLRCVWDVGAALGEGPVWHAAERALWFTDIKGARLHRFDPRTGARHSHALPHGAGFLVPAEGSLLVLGMDLGLHLFEAGQVTQRLARVDAPAGTRINDGTVDCHGRIWFGTMDDGETRKTGAVHVHDGDGVIRIAGGEAVITNGPAVTSDGAHLYHVDTAAGLVWRFDIARDHILRDGQVFARIAPEDGAPDGVTLDAEGCLWVCLWGGWGVRRYAPDGQLVAELRLPVSQVTKLAFGGDDLRTAFVTTARIGLPASALAAQPLAGGLFAFSAGVCGLAPRPARLPETRVRGVEPE